MKLKIITLFLCCFSLVSTWSQTISGTITDESTIPLPGVNIIIKGSSTGAVSDFDGGFSIKAKKGDILEFSYIGYKSQEITINSQTSLNIVLKEDTAELDEIVVIGYGQQKKESVLAAISQVKGEAIVESGATNIINALSDLSPGVSIVQGSGQPGADAGEIFIRGKTDVLVLIDGVETVGGFAYLNPEDIESVSILKDGAATAVYGIRGANGVIIVTTKRGKIGKPKVSITTEVNAEIFKNDYNSLDAFTAEGLRNIAANNDGVYNIGYSTQEDLAHYRDQDLPYIYPDTDWIDHTFNDAQVGYNQSISIRGGTEFVKYYASASYLQRNDITQSTQFFDYDPEHRLKRYTFRANLDFTLSKTTVLKTSVSNRVENINTAGTSTTAGSYLGLYNLPPGGGVSFYPAEVLEQYPDPLYPGLVEIRFPISSMVGNALGGVTNRNRTNFNIDFELLQELDFITPGLKFSGRYNFVSNNVSQRQTRFNTSLAVRLDRYDLERDGTWTSFEGADFERDLGFVEGNEGISSTEEIEYVKAQFDYNRSFGKHDVTGLAVVSRNRRISNVDFPFFEETWVARGTYNYDKRYFFEVSGSYNGDESFGPGNRFDFFPSFSVGVNLAKENFIKEHIPAINNFKIRYSYGETGTKAGLKIANTNPTRFNRWQYLGEYNSSNPRATRRFIFGEDGSAIETINIQTQIPNEELTWATVTKQNLGVEFGFYNNKISGELEFFKDEREGQISRIENVPLYFGSTAALPFANIEASESQGVELTLKYKNSTKGGFNYSITGIYGFNENRILASAEDGEGTPAYTTKAGKPAGTTAVLQTDGYFQNIDEVVNYPEYTGIGLGDLRYIDYNANGTVIGSELEDQIRFDLPRSPQHTFSLKLNGSYKGWSLGAVIGGITGHKGLIDGSLLYALPGGVAAGRTDQLDYWTPTNTDAKYPALHIVENNPNLAAANTDRIVSLDYIKLRSANLGYDFDMTNNKSISKLKVYLNGSNLLTFSDLDYADPEGNRPGVFPILPRVTLGLNMTF
ncbi:MAG: TonB-dependent receptor [Algibacter sp.]